MIYISLKHLWDSLSVSSNICQVHEAPESEKLENQIPKPKTKVKFKNFSKKKELMAMKSGPGWMKGGWQSSFQFITCKETQ